MLFHFEFGIHNSNILKFQFGRLGGFSILKYYATRKSVVLILIIGILLLATSAQAKRGRIAENRIGFVKTVEIDALGQITDTVIDTLEFDTANGEYPNIIQVSEYVYAIAYTQVSKG